MPIDTKHPSYAEYKTKWKETRDASAGEYAIHAGKILYLPRIEGWSDAQYEAYVKRASFFNAVGRTVDSLVGMVFRKPPAIDGKGIEALTDDVDMQGSSLSTFAQIIMREVILMSRVGALVEYPRVIGEVRTKAEQQSLNLRPYTSIYPTETIWNWEEKRVNNVMKTTLLVLSETHYEVIDEYSKDPIEQLRELRLVDNVYIQKIHRKNKKKKIWELIEEFTPLLNGKPLNFIPFYVFGSEKNTMAITDSPVLDMVRLNMHHYMHNADYSHGCHTSAMATLVISGLDLEEGQVVQVGGSIVSNNHLMRAEFVEVKSKYEALQEILATIENQMAVSGGRFLEKAKGGVEAAETLQIRNNGENSVLASLANLQSDQLSNMFEFKALWFGVKVDVKIKLNTDLLPTSMSPQQITALLAAKQSGNMSAETFFYNMQRGEMVQDGVTFEQEQERIEQQEPQLVTE